ncbi:SMI1/KNR4 family protein [Actinosynnema sp.]|uniref:SMI1/KNR4 family protein n=1 Tax=Actinosynnema sp. TaxID=1872144 RepID=UPI003F84AF9B
MLEPWLIAALERAVARLGIVVDPDCAHFAELFGACLVGVPVRAFGGSPLLEDVDVVALTLRFRADARVCAADPAGNPLFPDPTGLVCAADHDLGAGVRVLAEGFAAFLARHAHDGPARERPRTTRPRASPHRREALVARDRDQSVV